MQEVHYIRQAIKLLEDTEQQLTRHTHADHEEARNELLDEQYRDNVRWKLPTPTFCLQAVVEHTQGLEEHESEFPRNPFPTREVFTRDTNEMTELLADVSERVGTLLAEGESVTRIEVTYQSTSTGLDVEPVEPE